MRKRIGKHKHKMRAEPLGVEERMRRGDERRVRGAPTQTPGIFFPHSEVAVNWAAVRASTGHGF